MRGCGEGGQFSVRLVIYGLFSFSNQFGFRTGSAFDQAGLNVFNDCRISCFGVLITTKDSGVRGKRSGVWFLGNERL